MLRDGDREQMRCALTAAPLCHRWMANVRSQTANAGATKRRKLLCSDGKYTHHACVALIVRQISRGGGVPETGRPMQVFAAMQVQKSLSLMWPQFDVKKKTKGSNAHKELSSDEERKQQR